MPLEVQILSERFDIRVVPTGSVGRGVDWGQDSHFTVDTDFVEPAHQHFGTLVKDLFSSDVTRELSEQDANSFRARAVVARRRARVLAGQRWARAHIVRKPQNQPTILYSWWGFPEALGVAQQIKGMNIPVVTRMHGYDLFAEQDRLGFVPFQRDLVQAVDKVFSASKAGANYLCDRFPELRDKIDVSYLGVAKSTGTSQSSADDVFRIVSCSSLVPVKRVDILIDALKLNQTSGMNFVWTHIGDGPEMLALRKQSRELGSRARFLGEMTHDQVLAWMASNPIDVFCNVSDSEGLPVSLMEAASCGIPLLARDVGGVREIVDASVGLLLGSDAIAKNVAAGLEAMRNAPIETQVQWRIQSESRWAKKFDAERNYELFSGQLAALFD